MEIWRSFQPGILAVAALEARMQRINLPKILSFTIHLRGNSLMPRLDARAGPLGQLVVNDGDDVAVGGKMRNFKR